MTKEKLFGISKSKDLFTTSSRLAPYCVKLVLKTNITANQINIFCFLFIFIIAPFIAFGNYWVTLIGALLLQLIIVLDFSDGGIARAKKMVTLEGEYYSELQHTFIPPVLMIALSIKTYLYFNNPWWLFVGSIIILTMYMTIFSRVAKDSVALNHQLDKNKNVKAKPDLNIITGDTREGMKENYIFYKAKKHKILGNILFLVNSFSHILTTMLILAIFDVMHYAFFFYAIFYISVMVIKVYIEMKRGMMGYVFE